MRRLLSDTAIVAGRNLVRIKRAPDLLTAFTIQPVMFLLLFVYVFGGAIQTPGYDDYVRRTSGFLPLPPGTRPARAT